MKALAGSDFPADGTSFVGRRAEAGELKRLLSESRLVTLTGVGGVGKTRLALHVAEKVQRAFADGVRWVPLADVGDPGLLELTVMESIGRRTSSTAALTDYLHDRHVLLVLDNCEHLVDACAQLVTSLLPRCPGVRVLATSREVLNVEGERTFMVAPLPIRDGAADGSQSGGHGADAVALFAERAGAAAPGFRVTADNAQAVVSLCGQLDGLPLAIELAAVRLPALSVEDLLARRDERYELLAANDEVQALRHRSLRAAVDWSFELCSPEERLLWARLSVFAGGCDLEAAENVCSGEGLTRGEVLEAMSGLVEKSVLLREGVAGRARYQMLNTIHQYGRLQLQRSGSDAERYRQLHRDHYLKLAERVEGQWFGPGQVELFASVRDDHANLRAALEHCLADPGQARAGLHMAAALTIYWMACGLPREGLHWLERALATDASPSRDRAEALWAAALLHASGENPSPEAAADIVAMTEECRQLAEELGDPALLAHAIWLSGFGQLFGDDAARGFITLQEGVAAERALGAPNSYLTLALHHLTLTATLAGLSDLAAGAGEECLALCRAAGDRWLQSWTTVFLGMADWHEGRREDAVQRLQRAIELKQPFHDLLGIGCAIEFLGWSEITEGDAETGARLLGAATVFLKPLGLDFDNLPVHGIADDRRDHRALVRQARRMLGEGVYLRAYQSGTRLGQEEAVAFALGKDAGPAAAPSGSAGPKVLTRREEQIAEMLAEGLSNKEIAERLVIAQRTAESHVANILTKLGCTSRSQVAVWFIERRRAAAPGQRPAELPG
jgi:non-specific serine/threonine protein kinase